MHIARSFLKTAVASGGKINSTLILKSDVVLKF